MSSALGYCIFVVFLVHNIETKRVIGSECPVPEAILPCRCLPKGSEFQVWCSHSDLPKVLDGLHAVAQNITTLIDELILENNYLPSLPGRTFLPLKVVRLMVRQNALERVSSDWLAGLDSVLMELFIVEPKLRYLPDDSISQLNSLEAITIQTNSLKRLPRISSLQKLRYLQLESISLVDLSTNFQSLPSLKNFQISGSPKLKRLEANFLKDLPSLESVNISNCGINWLHPRAFSNLPRLKLLSLTGNKITDAGMIGRGAKDLISLKTLYLDYNYIDKLTEGSFVDLPHLEVLHLSNNNIIEIYHGAFHRVPRLKSLYLNWNVLRRVHPESFLQQSGSGLEELWLIHNDIAHITELKSLLDALPRLTFLDMSYNKLEIIPFGSLRGHPTLEVFKLNHNRLFQIDKESFMAMPALRELEIRNNSLSNFDGEPLWNLPSLKGLDVSYNYYRRLEPSFLVNLPSLRKFDLSGNQLVAINPMAFVVTPEIEYINISFNAIQHIHPATFAHLLNLYELDIRYNQLSEFVSGLPPVIEHLHLQNNKIKLFPSLFEKRTMLSLRVLDMSTNLLDHIPPYTLKHFAKLKKLSVDDNYIYRLEGGAFEGLSFLEILNIRNNKITHIHPDAFKGVLNLIELNLSNNNLETILPSTFQDMKNLKKLDVSRNKLADFLQGMLDTALDLHYVNVSDNFLLKLPPSLSKMEGLKILDLSNNRLKNVHSNILNNLKKLTELRLSRNFIQELKTGLIQDLRHLRFLYLDNNEIVNIESNSIQSLPKLELIKLNRNNISFIPSYTFNNLTMLQVAELQENSLKAVANNAFNIVPNLLVMNLSHNNFKNFDDIGLPSLRSLEVLDLSYNELVKMDTNSLQMMEWLVELKIDNNYICGIHGSPFNAMPRLRVVSLRQNKIMHITEQVLDKIRTNIAVFDLDGNPLECNCNIQWLQVWAQESQSVGPRCIDGKLLREIEFITEDCKSRQHIDQIQSICESDSTYYDTSQVFSKYTHFNNISHDVRGNDNSLAPLPEESEYFYDEYVDYPFNQSLVMVPNNTVALSNRNNNGISSNTEKSSHLIPGDTPTIYAASRNKSKPEIPKEVINSPSSSGFTFFGVPLPNINLNQLWGNGQRTNLKKLDAIPQVADRKSAVMNKPPNAGKFLPLDRGTRINNFGPPSVPVIQTGGFFPVLPGSGGFKPIPNPMVLPQPTSQVNVQIRRVNNTFHGGNKASSFPQRKVMNTPAHEIFPQNIQATTKPSISKRNESYSLRMPSSSTASYDTTSQENKYLIPDFQPASESKKEEIVISENIDVHKKDPNVTRIEFVTIKISTQNVIIEPETTIAPYSNSSGNSSNEVIIEEDSHDQEQHTADVKDSGIFDDMMPAAHVSIATNTNEDNMKSQENNSHSKDVELRNSTKDLELASSLSTLLVPGGQQTQIKPAGRPTITKVPSPHASSIIPGSNNKKTRSHNKENETGHATEDNDNWYFANYNNSFSEPFVSLSGCGYVSVKYISISIIFNVLFVMYSQLYILVI